MLSGRPLEVRLLPTVLGDAVTKAAGGGAQGRLQGARGAHPQQGRWQLPCHGRQGNNYHHFRQLSNKCNFSGLWQEMYRWHQFVA